MYGDLTSPVVHTSHVIKTVSVINWAVSCANKLVFDSIFHKQSDAQYPAASIKAIRKISSGGRVNSSKEFGNVSPFQNQPAAISKKSAQIRPTASFRAFSSSDLKAARCEFSYDILLKKVKRNFNLR